MFSDFIAAVKNESTPVKIDTGVFPESPSLIEKRKAAIAYLGDRWILANKVEKLESARKF